MTWVIIPGLACPPQAYDSLRDVLAGDGGAVAYSPRKVPLAASAAQVRAYLEELVPDGPVDIFAHSLGGLVALDAVLNGLRVHRLILADATSPFQPDVVFGVSRPPSHVPGWLAGALSPAATVAARVSFGVPVTVTGEDVNRILAENASIAARQRRVRDAWQRAGVPVDVYTRVLVGAGNDDSSDFVAEQRHLGAELGASVELIMGHGHHFPMTAPEWTAWHCLHAAG